MNQVLFTKKHIIVSIGIGCLIILLVVGSWLLLISPKKAQVETAKKELNTSQSEIATINQELSGLRANPTLFESAVVKEAPIISNGIRLENYFQELKGVSTSLSVSIQNVVFEHFLVFPEEQSAEKQLRKSVIGFDVIGNSGRDLIAFVDGLEQGNRFVKVQNVTYRASESMGDESYAYSATVVIEMYYLSNFETGKANEEVKGQ
ncbi:hypothetical protein [Isobaculum melis]|uniref:Tfp pilus assembly protein PilO n=1 Tax=Isobaculum melis TaxID=142588 RepID=A0A1H9S3K9_9LACT|nr:hypothetical protein [Isobaculum melis]SER79612.1 hypothetical protein SAMN04488559_10681 [Isobaculum melis]